MAKQLLFSYGDYEENQAMEAVLFAMREKGIIAEIEAVMLGEEPFKQGNINGYLNDVLQKLERVKILLKSPTKPPAEYDIPRENSDHDIAPHMHISNMQSEDKFYISRNLCSDLSLNFAHTETDDYYIHAGDEIFIFEPKNTDPQAMFKVAEMALEKLEEIVEEE